MICRNDSCFEYAVGDGGYCSEICALDQQRFNDFVEDDDTTHEGCAICESESNEDDEC